MKIAIHGYISSEETLKYTQILIDSLERKQASIYMEEAFYDKISPKLKSSGICGTFSSHEDLDNSFDLMFTIGGDGTLLRSIKYIRDLEIPVIGVNIGRLGFLATLQKDEIPEAIEAIASKNYNIEERSLLSVSTSPEKEELKELYFALNEVTINRKDTASMITIDTYLDDEFLTSYWADGLILSTPTGSTGYSLSCGGPVIKPQTKSFTLTPIAPHNLNARPLVIPDDTKVKMRVNGRENEYFISLDSRIATIDNETDIFIEKANFSLKVISLKSNSFIETLRKKLLWGEDTRNK